MCVGAGCSLEDIGGLEDTRGGLGADVVDRDGGDAGDGPASLKKDTRAHGMEIGRQVERGPGARDSLGDTLGHLVEIDGQGRGWC